MNFALGVKPNFYHLCCRNYFYTEINAQIRNISVVAWGREIKASMTKQGLQAIKHSLRHPYV